MKIHPTWLWRSYFHLCHCTTAISCQSVLTEALLLRNEAITHKYPESMSGNLTCRSQTIPQRPWGQWHFVVFSNLGSHCSGFPECLQAPRTNKGWLFHWHVKEGCKLGFVQPQRHHFNDEIISGFLTCKMFQHLLKGVVYIEFM